MKQWFRIWLVLLSVLWPGSALAEGTLGLPCQFKTEVRKYCGDYGCVVADMLDPDLIAPGTVGICQLCRIDAECDGLKCDTVTGMCRREIQRPIPPEPFRPSFHLATAELTYSSGGDAIVGAGYLYQIALRKAHPMKRPGGGWITSDLPSWYGTLGLSAALAGDRQNVFVEAGLAYYAPGMPLYLSTLGVGALYQRQGDGIWDLGDEEHNSDKLGPALTLGFLQNAYLRVSYVFPLQGPESGSLLISVIYMKDLVNDLVPDRFQKYFGR